MKRIWELWTSISIVLRIGVALIIGIGLALIAPQSLAGITIFGSIFVGALKAIAPLMVFFLVVDALAKRKDTNNDSSASSSQSAVMKRIILLYLIGTLTAALLAVAASFIFQVGMTLNKDVSGSGQAPSSLVEVLRRLLLNIVSNPLTAISNANYISIVVWAVLFGIGFKSAPTSVKDTLSSIASALSLIVKWIINLAPFGVMGLVFPVVADGGLGALHEYLKLIMLLVAVMLVVALVLNPIIVFFQIGRNPYPLTWKCLRYSGITAFFTRSSAANIPVNMSLCEELELDKDVYSVSIPLGATANMAGAAVTITIMTLAAVKTLGIEVSFATALLLSLLATLGACGTSGVAGGSILLIPMAAALFGIDSEVAMQIVGVGFVIGVIQDSCETALNSSSDVLFTCSAEFAQLKKEGKPLPIYDRR